MTRARAAALRLVDEVTAAATALDAVDARCATGDRWGARRAWDAHAADVARGGTAVAAVPRAVRGYAAALDALPPSGTAAAVLAGRREVAALQSFVAVAGAAWRQYAALEHEEQTWLTRAFVPWYRTQQEAADAYAVMVGDARSALDAARGRLAAASAALGRAEAVAVAAFAAADRAPAA